MVIKFVFFICLFFFSSLSIAQTNSHAHHKQAPAKKEAETNKMLIENKGYEFSDCTVTDSSITQEVGVTSGEQVFSLTYSLSVNDSTLGVESAVITKVASQVAI